MCDIEGERKKIDALIEQAISLTLPPTFIQF